jgi:hypothetical protein
MSVDREREEICNKIRAAWHAAGLSTAHTAGTVSEFEVVAYMAGQQAVTKPTACSECGCPSDDWPYHYTGCRNFKLMRLRGSINGHI